MQTPKMNRLQLLRFNWQLFYTRYLCPWCYKPLKRVGCHWSFVRYCNNRKCINYRIVAQLWERNRYRKVEPPDKEALEQMERTQAITRILSEHKGG